MKKYILYLPILILLLSACSSKEVFKPELVGDDWHNYKSIDDDIVDTSLNIAKLDNNKVLTKDGVLDIKVDEDHRVIAESDGWVITATIDGNLTLRAEVDASLEENFALKKTVASASVLGDTLAVLFSDNEIALYSISTKEILFKEQGGKSLAVDVRIVPPLFMNGLVLFATLDGKVIIVNEKKRKRLRTIIVSSEDNFNNVIYMNLVDNKIVAATAYKILAISTKEVREKYEVRDVLYDGTDLFVATKQGEVVSLTPDLQLKGKLKFPFAHFLGMLSKGDYLYILEKEGYMIVLNKNMKDYTVHDVDIGDGFILVTPDAFYADDEKIIIK